MTETETESTTTTSTPVAPKPASIVEYYDRERALRDLRTFNADLSIDFMRQAALYAYWAAKLVQAEHQHDQLSERVRILEARLDKDIRDKAAVSGTKVTEAQVSKLVMLDARVITMGRLLREAKAQVGYLKSTCIAFAQRKDMLQQLGFSKSKEEAATGMAIGQSTKRNHEERMRQLQSLEPDD